MAVPLQPSHHLRACLRNCAWKIHRSVRLFNFQSPCLISLKPEVPQYLKKGACTLHDDVNITVCPPSNATLCSSHPPSHAAYQPDRSGIRQNSWVLFQLTQTISIACIHNQSPSAARRTHCCSEFAPIFAIPFDWPSPITIKTELENPPCARPPFPRHPTPNQAQSLALRIRPSSFSDHQ